jgi:hypothetical protein
VNGIKIETSETLGFSICTSVQSLSLPGGRFAGGLRDGFVVEESFGWLGESSFKDIALIESASEGCPEVHEHTARQTKRP